MGERTVDDGTGEASRKVEAGEGREANGPPRVVTAERRQVELRPSLLEAILPAAHRARAVWAFIERLDLQRFYAPIRARGAEPGRPASDPKVLIALWLYATCEGVGSARELARLCEEHDAYRWLRGGVPVNHHTLRDFRTGHEAALDELFTQVLAAFLKAGVVRLERVAQDGTRVRASAGKSSFRRAKRLAVCLEQARAQVAAVKVLGAAGEDPPSARVQAAQARAARERRERVERAGVELAKVQALHARQRGGKRSRSLPKASTTDAEARRMRMGDGGYRPAYNVQLATDVGSRVIVGVGVTNEGTDSHQVEPMLAQIERRLGERPAAYVVDAGLATEASVATAEQQGVTMYAPVPARKQIADPYAPRAHDSAEVAAWRARMGTPAAQAIYRARAATAETVNADLQTWRGLDRFGVRGLRKTLSVGLWSALAYNALRWMVLMGSGA